MTGPAALAVLVHDPRVREFTPATLAELRVTGWARLPDGDIRLQSDPAATRPFCYRMLGRTLHLACYPGDLARLGPPPELDWTTLAGLPRFRFPDDGATAFAGIHRLAAGTTTTIAPDGGTRSHRWWELPPEPSSSAKPDLFGALVQQCAGQIQGRQCAILLSGGLDSSAIAAAAVAAARAGGGPDPILASLVYPGLPCDEDLTQEAIARHYGLTRVTVNPVGRPVWPGALGTVHSRLAPVVDTQSAAIGQLFEQLEAAGCRVVLTGLGGDVLFRGIGLEGSLLRQGRLLAIHRHFRGISRALPVSVPRLWWAGVLRPLATGRRGPGLSRAEVLRAGSSVRSTLIRNLAAGGTGWLTEAVEQSGNHRLALESPFYGAAFLDQYSRLTQQDFASSASHKGILREMIRPHLPAAVVNRVRKPNFLDYHATWLHRERSSLAARYREVRPMAPASIDMPADISRALNATSGSDGFSSSWMSLTMLEFLAAWNLRVNP